ncbi:MAG: 3-keto-disaccharide hydrolase [Opitutaceae bacterium]
MHPKKLPAQTLSRRLLQALGAAFLVAFAPARAAESPDLAPIFNGKDLAGWNAPAPNPFWRVVDGVLIGENNEQMKGHVLRTEKAYHDFVLELEARWTSDADTGIIFRQPDLQVQIGVSISLKVEMTCSIYTGGEDKYPAAGRARNVETLLKRGEWNRIRLEAKGDTFTVWLNGEQVVRYANAKFPSPAPIGLQIHQNLKMKAEFRNIRAKALD